MSYYLVNLFFSVTIPSNPSFLALFFMFSRISFLCISVLLAWVPDLFAITTRVATAQEKDQSAPSQVWDSIVWVGTNIINIIIFIILLWVLLKLIRLTYEVVMA